METRLLSEQARTAKTWNEEQEKVLYDMQIEFMSICLFPCSDVDIK